TGLPYALRPYGVERRRGLAVRRLDVRHVGRRGEQIIHEGSVQELPARVVHELLVERVADAMRDAAVALPVPQPRTAPAPPVPPRPRTRPPASSRSSRAASR